MCRGSFSTHARHLNVCPSRTQLGAAIALGDAYDIKGDMAAAYQTRLEGVEMSKATGDIYPILIANFKVAVTLRMQDQLQRVQANSFNLINHGYRDHQIKQQTPDKAGCQVNHGSW